MSVQYVKTARASFASFLTAIALDGNAVGDVVYMDAVLPVGPSPTPPRASAASLPRYPLMRERELSRLSLHTAIRSSLPPLAS